MGKRQSQRKSQPPQYTLPSQENTSERVSERKPKIMFYLINLNLLRKCNISASLNVNELDQTSWEKY